MWKLVSGIALLACIVGFAAAEETETPDFDRWLSEFRTEALARDIDTATLDAAFAETRPLDRVLELDRHQPESTLSFDAYLARVINDKRVRDGRARLERHGKLLAQLQEEYDVQPHVLVALWGIESDFGRRTGSFSVIDALATLAYDGRRSAFFRGELMHALTILDDGHVEPARMLGSWAGAMGQPQFMPSSFHAYAVDHDGDSRRDIWGSTADALASAANYLATNGWRGDLRWGREVRLPEGFAEGIGDERRSLREWQELGVRCRNGSTLPTADVSGRVVRPDGSAGPAYLVYDNYEVLLHWNRSHYFASAVGILSDRIRAVSVGTPL